VVAIVLLQTITCSAAAVMRVGGTKLTLGGATVGSFSPSPGSYTSHGDLLLAELRLWDVALGLARLGTCTGGTTPCQTVSGQRGTGGGTGTWVPEGWACRSRKATVWPLISNSREVPFTHGH